jgi:flagellar assembly factor FliW
MQLTMTVLAESARSTGTEAREVVTFHEGLIGLPAARCFAFESSPDVEPLLRMRCLDRPDLSFLVVDPALLVPSYRPRFAAEALAALGIGERDKQLVLAIAKISPRIEECSANLLAPLLINPATMSGRQVVLEPGAYTTRHPLVAS